VASKRPAGWIAAALAALLLAGVFAVLWQRAAARRDPPFVVRMSLGDSRLAIPISPDGSTLLWASADDLRLRRLDDLRPRRLPGTEGAQRPFWAGDSSAIGFFQQGKLCIMPLATQEVRVVAVAPEPGGASWRGTATGGDIVFISAGKLMHLSLSSGMVRVVPVVLPAGQVPLNPTFLPQGEDFVFTASFAERDTRTLYRASLRGGTPTSLLETPSGVQFALHPHTGKWFVFYSTSAFTKLMAVPVDPATGQPAGESVQILDGVGTFTETRRYAAEFSPNGRIVFRRNFSAAPVFRIRWHAPDGRVLASLGDRIAANEILLSPDENHIAAITGYPRRSVTIFDARTGDSRRLTSASEHVGQGVAWSRDARTLYYQIEQPDGKWGIVRQNADGSTRPERIGRSDVTVTLMDISPDGAYLIFGPNQTSGSSYLRLLTASTAANAADSKPEVWASFGSDFRPRGGQGRFTPDGRFVFAPGNAIEASFIPWLPGQPAVTAAAGSVTFPLSGPFFSADGRRLCGIERERGSVVCRSVTAVPGQAPSLGLPSVLFTAALPQLSAYSKIGTIAKDGRILLLSTDEPEEVEMQFLSDCTALLPAR
jgi:Tol biopolymer transport system component